MSCCARDSLTDVFYDFAVRLQFSCCLSHWLWWYLNEIAMEVSAIARVRRNKTSHKKKNSFFTLHRQNKNTNEDVFT